MHMRVCLHVHPANALCLQGLVESVGSPELEFQVAVNYHTGTEPQIPCKSDEYKERLFVGNY